MPAAITRPAAAVGGGLTIVETRHFNPGKCMTFSSCVLLRFARAVRNDRINLDTNPRTIKDFD
jgi:hypothetical protein